jgi:hypothetical protein
METVVFAVFTTVASPRHPDDRRFEKAGSRLPEMLSRGKEMTYTGHF